MTPKLLRAVAVLLLMLGEHLPAQRLLLAAHELEMYTHRYPYARRHDGTQELAPADWRMPAVSR